MNKTMYLQQSFLVDSPYQAELLPCRQSGLTLDVLYRDWLDCTGMPRVSTIGLPSCNTDTC